MCCPQWVLLFLPVSAHCDVLLYCSGHRCRSYQRILGSKFWSGGHLQGKPGNEVCVLRGNGEEKPWVDVGWRTWMMSLLRHVHGLWMEKCGQLMQRIFGLLLPSTTSTFILLTVLPSGRGNIPDARRQLALSPLMGGVAWTIAGAPPLLFPVMFCSSSSFSRTATGTAPVQTHGPDLRPLLVVAVQRWHTTLLTCEEMGGNHNDAHLVKFDY